MGSRGMAMWIFLVTLALATADVSLTTNGGGAQFTCRSPEQETFTCFWTYGDFPNMTDHVKMMYTSRKDATWRECPDYKSAGENSCYFNKTYTSVWTSYCLKLVSDNATLTDYCFAVEDIVRPDPPLHLNWTLLNISLTGIHADIQVRWEPPPSADIKNGWLTLLYELQYKEVNETTWVEMDPVNPSTVPVYSLKADKDYEIRVRCRPHTSGSYGEFSEILYVQLTQYYIVHFRDEPKFPWLLFAIFGTFGGAIVLLLILFSKQKKIKMLILPPVPVPKIKGINPELLKKGKLDELNFILASHESYKPQLYDDSWVEFIELDIDDPDEKTEGSDTERLLSNDHLKSNCLGVKDDDSGRASCCEPDIPETDFSASDTCDGTSDIVRSQKMSESEDLVCLDLKESDESPSSSNAPTGKQLSGLLKSDDMESNPLLSGGMQKGSPPFSMQMSNQSTKTSMDFYALVSDITPAGKLLLSPGQKSKMESEYCQEPFMPCQPAFNMVSAYVCESNAGPFCAMSLHEKEQPRTQPSFNEDAYFTTESLTAAMKPCDTDEATIAEMPVPDYTSIHIINSSQSIVLNAALLPAKDAMASCGYMTTDQVNKVMP